MCFFHFYHVLKKIHENHSGLGDFGPISFYSKLWFRFGFAAIFQRKSFSSISLRFSLRWAEAADPLAICTKISFGKLLLQSSSNVNKSYANSKFHGRRSLPLRKDEIKVFFAEWYISREERTESNIEQQLPLIASEGVLRAKSAFKSQISKIWTMIQKAVQ